jgi:Uma2 family endonuclease
LEAIPMAMLVCDPFVEERLRAEREAKGLDLWDEVWEGMYVMAPLANDEHQFLQTRLATILDFVVGLAGKGEVRAGVNVSDRIEQWEHNYRCPDVAVFLNGGAARNCGTHWVGGPDFAIEVTSPKDKSRDKLDFYAAVGVHELLLIDRDPWSLVHYALQGGALVEVGRSTPPSSLRLESTVVPLSLRLLAGGARPTIEVIHRDSGQKWLV